MGGNTCAQSAGSAFGPVAAGACSTSSMAPRPRANAGSSAIEAAMQGARLVQQLTAEHRSGAGGSGKAHLEALNEAYLRLMSGGPAPVARTSEYCVPPRIA